MKKNVLIPMILVAATMFTSTMANAQTVPTVPSAGMINHDIFITLKNPTPEAIEKQLELGRKYLTNHPGEVSFSSTVVAQGLTRHKQVSYLYNETDFSVAFHMVFANAKAHDEYQVSDAHVNHFIPLSNPNWTKIRVFDSVIE